MEVTNAQFSYFVNEYLKLPQGRSKEYKAQADRLIANLWSAADKQPNLGITKFLKTGSLWKGTVLRPASPEYGVDADIAVYIDSYATSPEVLDDLHARLRHLLMNSYPTKRASDFTVQPRTLGIHFVDSGLDIDLVPIVTAGHKDGYGYQPSSSGEPLILSSVPLQLEFIRKHKEEYYNWTATVRLLKRWRNHRELSQLRSFTIELIVCFLQDRDGPPTSIGEGLSRFWMFLAQELASTTVWFSATNGGLGVGNIERSPVCVIDPVNAENNVARRITHSELDELAATAEESWELFWAATDVATKAGTLEYLKQLFGRSFAIEE